MTRTLLRCERGAMALTLSQLFLGAITLGLGTFRGTEAYVSFHYEGLVGHANYAASKMAGDHARAANAIANNNVISAAIMGPRFAVEADNITMDEDAKIACPQIHNAFMQMVCRMYQKNKPRALAKLTWVRAKQHFLWSSLGKLSGDMDKIASLRALERVTETVGAADSRVKIRAEDPAATGSIWGQSNIPVACTLAQKDALPSLMPGAAFPTLMPNLLEGLPKALVQTLPRAICGALGNTGAIRLPEVPTVAKQTHDDCARLEEDMLCQVTRASNPRGGAWGAGCGAFVERSFTPVDPDAVPEFGTPQFSSEVKPYVACSAMTPTSGVRTLSGGGYTYRSGPRAPVMTCTFDRAKCSSDKLGVNSASYLRELGLPSIPDFAALGGATRAPSDPDWNHSSSFRACAYASKPVDETITAIADAARTLASFGQAPKTDTLRQKREYRACGKWYFPDGPGSSFQSVPHEQQPFVAAWKWALVAGRP